MPQPTRPTSSRPAPAAPGGARPPASGTRRPAGIRLQVDSDPAHLGEVRKQIEAFAAAAGFAERAVADLGLSVNEAMANVIRHAYSGAADRPIVVTADLDNCDAVQVRVKIRDWGNGVNPLDRPPPPFDPTRPGGLGLVCLKQLMDEVVFAPQADGMLLTMMKRKA
jgi:serine/threonine-protein kinase RsbW